MKKKLTFILMMGLGFSFFAEEKIFRYLQIIEDPQYNTMTLAVCDMNFDVGIDFDTSKPGTIIALLNRKNARLIKNSILPNLESSWYGYTSYIYIGLNKMQRQKFFLKKNLKNIWTRQSRRLINLFGSQKNHGRLDF